MRRPSRTTIIARRGAAFLTLVVLLLLVIVWATKDLVISEASSRRHESARIRGNTLVAAIELARREGLVNGETMRLPIDTTKGQWVEVTADQDEITAQWYQGDRVQQTATRPATTLEPSDEQE